MEERELERIKRMSLKTSRNQLVDLLIILFLNMVLILVFWINFTLACEYHWEYDMK